MCFVIPSIGYKNPYRYRGYRYDAATKLYYLQSRYYNPELGRFINADVPEVLDITEKEILGTNLFAYCSNNPVNNIDPTGHAPRWYHLVKGLWLLGTGLVALISAIAKGFVRSALGSFAARIIGWMASSALALMPIGQFWGTVINVAIIVTMLWKVKALLYNIPAGLWHLKQVIKHNHK